MEETAKKLPKYMKVIDNEYILHSTHTIGKGSFGKVVYGRTINDKDICFKFEKTNAHKNSILKEELKIYNQIKGGFGIPKIFSCGTYKNCRYIVMELIGPSLDKFFILCEKKLKLETVIYLGLQMIDRIEHFHSKGFIHRDIKPNNFLFGKFNRQMTSEDKTVHIIDFGLSTTYLEHNPDYKESTALSVNTVINTSAQVSDQQVNPAFRHIPMKEGARFVGTPRYASLNTHLGIRQSRRDDMESIAYIIIYFLIGDLPWQGVKAKTKSEKKEKIKQLKQVLNVENEQMFDSLPQELKDFLKYCKNLMYLEKPNYNYLRNLLISLRNKHNFPEVPLILEWEDLFTQGAYTEMKKKYKILYEGYPTIPFNSYVEMIEQRKNQLRKSINTKNNPDSDLSNIETTTNSELRKRKVSNKKKADPTMSLNNDTPTSVAIHQQPSNNISSFKQQTNCLLNNNKFRISFDPASNNPRSNILHNLLGRKTENDLVVKETEKQIIESSLRFKINLEPEKKIDIDIVENSKESISTVNVFGLEEGI